MHRSRVTKPVALVSVIGLMVLAGSGVANGRSDGNARSHASSAATGTLTIAAAQGITSLDPHRITFTWEHVLYPLLWSGLVKYTETGSTDLKPDLAASWSASRDSKTWTFKLRNGLKYSNGAALTAKDVVQSVLRAKDPKTGFYKAGDLTAIWRVKAVNATTVRFVLNRPLATFPWNLVKVRIIDPKNLSALAKNPPTSGPFKVAEFVQDDHVVLVPNSNYWGAASPLAQIRVVRAASNPAAVASLRAGDIQALWNVSWTDIEPLKQDSNVRVVFGQTPPTNVIINFDTQSPPFNKLKARQALAYAVDRRTMVNAAYAGSGRIPLTNQPIPPNNSIFNKALAKYTFNLNKAKTLFTEAGITKDTKLTFWTPTPAYPEWRIVGQILQQDLAKIGLELAIETAEINTWASKFYPAGKRWPGLIVPNLMSGPPPQIFYSFKSGVNEANWSNKEYDSVVDKAAGTTDKAEQKRFYDRAQQILWQQVPTIIYNQISIPVATRSNVANLWIDPIGFPRLENARLR